MKILFFLLLTTTAFGQAILDTSAISLNIDDIRDRSTSIIGTPATTAHRSDTLQTEWVVIAGSDGVLRKERQVIVIKEYDHVTNGFWQICENVKYRRLDGELIDVVLIKENE